MVLLFSKVWVHVLILLLFAQNCARLCLPDAFDALFYLISEILYPTAAVQAGDLNRRTIKHNIPVATLLVANLYIQGQNA